MTWSIVLWGRFCFKKIYFCRRSYIILCYTAGFHKINNTDIITIVQMGSIWYIQVIINVNMFSLSYITLPINSSGKKTIRTQGSGVVNTYSCQHVNFIVWILFLLLLGFCKLVCCRIFSGMGRRSNSSQSRIRRSESLVATVCWQHGTCNQTSCCLLSQASGYVITFSRPLCIIAYPFLLSCLTFGLNFR